MNGTNTTHSSIDLEHLTMTLRLAGLRKQDRVVEEPYHKVTTFTTTPRQGTLVYQLTPLIPESQVHLVTLLPDELLVELD